MMHLKTAAFLGKHRYLIGGQANYTPSAFNGARLETGLVVASDAVVDAFLRQFDTLWGVSAVPRKLPAPSRWLRRALLWFVGRTRSPSSEIADTATHCQSYRPWSTCTQHAKMVPWRDMGCLCCGAGPRWGRCAGRARKRWRRAKA